MSDIVDSLSDALLREAEERLQHASTTALAPPKSARAFKSINPPLSSRPKTGEELRMREPKQVGTKQGSEKTAGANWFQLPKTEVTPELKRDWQILRMRNILDPKHQRKNLRAALPAYSQVGEVIAGPTEYYSARLTRKERKRTLLEEVMSTHDRTKLRTKYAGIQRAKTSGKKAFYEKVKMQRRKRRG